MTDDEMGLDALFLSYRAACPDVEPSPQFMPNLWRKIEARRTFGSAFERLARAVVAASAAMCLLLLVLNFVSTSDMRTAPLTYTDALLADHTAENTYYTEALRNSGRGNVPDVEAR